MIWLIGLLLATVILVLSVLAAFLRRKSRVGGGLLAPINILFTGTFLSATVLFIPIYANMLTGGLWSGLKTVLISAHSAIRLFVVDADFMTFTTMASTAPGQIGDWYGVLASVLYVLAPVLTFGVILSFFASASAMVRYLLHWRSDLYLFSELNERSFTLASSIRRSHPKALLLFTDVYENHGEESGEYVGRAKALGAICCKEDILLWNLHKHSKKANASLFVMGADSDENINHMLELASANRDRANTNLYVFSSNIESELLLSGTDKGAVKVRRINEARSLVYRTLYERGNILFESARPTESGKRISVVIVGLGDTGTEMLRALVWFCQMDGYEVRLSAVDADASAKSRFAADHPELMSPEHNGVYVEGDAQYKIDILPGVDVDTEAFNTFINEVEEATFVFVALGSDALNISTAVKLRMLFERRGMKPIIDAVVWNSEKRASIERACNFRRVPYNIEFIGDLDSSYSEDVIINSELEQKALERHLKYNNCEDDFWNYEYNYCSSMALAIHMRARKDCGFVWAGKRDEDLTMDERKALEELEHRRWNAYMRSVGYVFSGSREKKSRNDMAKMHHDLVPYAELSEGEKRIDSRVGTE